MNAYLQSHYLVITAAGFSITTIHISITYINILIMSSNNPAQDFIDDLFAHIADDAITALLEHDTSHVEEDEDQLTYLMQER